MNTTKIIAYIFLILMLIIFGCFFYQGIKNPIPVSIDYNIPIAHSIVSGEFLTINSAIPYYYFPGSSNLFLALFITFGWPINLFGLMGWTFLFFIAFKLAQRFALSNAMAVIYTGSICTTMSVVRTVGDQSIDKWLCAWFLMALYLLEKPEKNWKFAVLVGLSLGMLIGTKYSGPLFFIALLLVYGKRLFQALNIKRFFLAGGMFTLTGLFWYIRNLILEGSPLYPANLPFLKGFPNYTQQDWMVWKVIIQYPPAIPDLINSFLSEYLVWAFSGAVVFGFIVYSLRKKKQVDENIKRLSLLGLTTGAACLFLPITTPYRIELFHIISDMRYIYIHVFILMLVVYLLAIKYKRTVEISSVALLNAIPIFSFVPYLPKIYLLVIFFAILLYFKRPKTLQL